MNTVRRTMSVTPAKLGSPWRIALMKSSIIITAKHVVTSAGVVPTALNIRASGQRRRRATHRPRAAGAPLPRVTHAPRRLRQSSLSASSVINGPTLANHVRTRTPALATPHVQGKAAAFGGCRMFPIPIGSTPSLIITLASSP